MVKNPNVPARAGISATPAEENHELARYRHAPRVVHGAVVAQILLQRPPGIRAPGAGVQVARQGPSQKQQGQHPAPQQLRVPAAQPDRPQNRPSTHLPSPLHQHMRCGQVLEAVLCGPGSRSLGAASINIVQICCFRKGKTAALSFFVIYAKTLCQ